MWAFSLADLTRKLALLSLVHANRYVTVCSAPDVGVGLDHAIYETLRSHMNTNIALDGRIQHRDSRDISIYSKSPSSLNGPHVGMIPCINHLTQGNLRRALHAALALSLAGRGA
jgi:hypothetical protein